jgi:hypothetical protein
VGYGTYAVSLVGKGIPEDLQILTVEGNLYLLTAGTTALCGPKILPLLAAT